MERLLKASEVVALTGIPRTSVYKMAATGELPSVRYGARAVRIPQSALERWIAERTTPAASVPQPLTRAA